MLPFVVSLLKPQNTRIPKPPSFHCFSTTTTPFGLRARQIVYSQNKNNCHRLSSFPYTTTSSLASFSPMSLFNNDIGMESDDANGNSVSNNTSTNTNNTDHTSNSNSSMVTSNNSRNTLTAAATTADYHHDFINVKNNSDQVIEVDIVSYLTAIENELLSIGNQTFRVKVRAQARRPMIRTLLNIETKDEFYGTCREVKTDLEYKKILNFIVRFEKEIVTLYDHESALIDEKIPFFRKGFDSIMKYSSTSSTTTPSSEDGDDIDDDDDDGRCYNWTRGISSLRRLASGREYKGSIINMVQDLTPHLADECAKALTPLTEVEVLLATIDAVVASQNDNNKCQEKNVEAIPSLSTSLQIREECISAAKSLVLGLETNHEDDDSSVGTGDDSVENNIKSDNSSLNKMNGLECEQACISYLEEEQQRYNSTIKSETENFILQNVLVNHKSTQNRSKYSNGNMRNNSGGWKNFTESSSTGIIWTNSERRENLCSEFDAIVLHHSPDDSSSQISEFWEAKHSVSPSSLHDAMTKKLSAIRSVLEDDEVTISHSGGHYKLNVGNREGDRIKFGLFGKELLSPSNAIGQLRSMAASYAMTSYVDAALEAAKNGYVEVEVQYIQKHLHDLKEQLVQNSDFEFVVRIER